MPKLDQLCLGPRDQLCEAGSASVASDSVLWHGLQAEAEEEAWKEEAAKEEAAAAAWARRRLQI